MVNRVKQPHGSICGARTRAGGFCRKAPCKGKNRCYFHGGAEGSGAPQGNRNAWKHGEYSRQAKEERRQGRLIRELIEAFVEGNFERMAELQGQLD